jgi:nicotinamide-nucleotide amidase
MVAGVYQDQGMSKAPRIELLNTGNELLLGSVRDSHLSWFGRELFPLGLRVTRQSTVPDGVEIREALLDAFGRCDVLLVTGGLGPTTDDLTREMVSEILGLRLHLHSETLDRIKERCRRRGFEFQQRMERQAMVPSTAIVLPNEHGTAPGLHIPPVGGVSWESPRIFLLPGPPRELEPMARNHVLPILKQLYGENNGSECRIYRVAGMGESLVEARLGLALSERGDLEVGYCARPNEVDFRLIGPKAVLDEVEPLVIQSLGSHLVTVGEESMEAVVVRLLRETSMTLSVAESCTGGMIADHMTNVPGASEAFLEGFVTYSNASKSDLLGVPTELLRELGAVSEPVVRSMAEGALAKSGATRALATSGIAGPGGGSTEKPVGLVWFALARKGAETTSWSSNLTLERIAFKRAATRSALDALRKDLLTLKTS